MKRPDRLDDDGQNVMNMHLAEDDLVLHYYGEMTDREETAAVAHLRACASCHESYRRLQRVLAAVDEHAFAAPALPDHFERTVWARIEPAIGREQRGWSWLGLSPARLALAASVVLLVGVAFFAGRLMPRDPAVPPETTAAVPAAVPANAAAAAAQLRERILLVDLGDHLEQSQMVLIELVSAGEQAPLRMIDERARAEQLVAANRLYRQTAVSTGDTGIADLLDDLERVLIDIAASPDELSS
jgi:hypothetical protein